MDDPDLLWAMLLVDGPSRLSDEEQCDLILLLAGLPASEREAYAPDDLGEAMHLTQLSGLLSGRDLNELAVLPARMGLAGAERLGAGSAQLLPALLALIQALYGSLVRDEVMTCDEARQVVERMEAVLATDPDDGWSVIAAFYRALLERLDGGVETAAAALAGLLPRAVEILGQDSDWVQSIRTVYADIQAGRGNALIEAGRPAEAVAPLRQGLDALAGRPADRRRWGEISYLLALAHWRASDADDATVIALFEDSAAAYDAADAGGGDTVFVVREALGVFLWQRGRHEEALALLEDNLAEAGRRLGADHEIVSDLAVELPRFRRAWLRIREGGKLFGWALTNHRQALAGDRFALAVAMLRDVAKQAETAELHDLLLLEAAVLLAASGRGEEALAVSDGVRLPSIGGWDEARVWAAGAAALADSQAREAWIGRAVAKALATHVAESGDGKALIDLIEALSWGGEAAGALALLEADSRPVCREVLITARVENDDLGGALALLDRWGDAELDDSVLIDLIELAARQKRRAVVERFAPLLAGTRVAHISVSALLFVGAEDEGLALITRLESGWSRTEALSMAAEHFGDKGDAERCRSFAAQAAAELNADPKVFVFQPLCRMAKGLLGVMDVAGAMEWGRAHLAPGLVSEYGYAVACALEMQGRHDAAWSVAQDLDEDHRAQAESRIRTSRDNSNAVGAIAHSHKLVAAGKAEDAVSALASIANPFAVIEECIGIAETCGDAGAAAQALRAAFGRLPGKLADGAICSSELRLNFGRKLGEAAGRILAPEAGAAFAEAALTRAAGMDDIIAAAPFVVAAGHAVRPHQRG